MVKYTGQMIHLEPDPQDLSENRKIPQMPESGNWQLSDAGKRQLTIVRCRKTAIDNCQMPENGNWEIFREKDPWVRGAQVQGGNQPYLLHYYY
jgi:hypothetical protein